jgi:hypothetical protein
MHLIAATGSSPRAARRVGDRCWRQTVRESSTLRVWPIPGAGVVQTVDTQRTRTRASGLPSVAHPQQSMG